MSSLSFDPVAQMYDATRGYPPEIAAHIAQSLANVANATPRTTFLEIGIGTGRIAFPLASLGHNYTGVDISARMLEQLEAKLKDSAWSQISQPWLSMPDEDPKRLSVVQRFQMPDQSASLRLVIADMTALPFQTASFDVTIAVHVFHLVDGWQRAVNEALRVLRPGGVFLHCWDEHIRSSDRKWSIESKWRDIITELGGSISRPGTEIARVDVTNYLQELGLSPQTIRPVRWQRAITPRQVLETITQRLWSSTWMVPDDLFQTSVALLERWAYDHFGPDMDIPQPIERQFVISKTRV